MEILSDAGAQVAKDVFNGIERTDGRERKHLQRGDGGVERVQQRRGAPNGGELELRRDPLRGRQGHGLHRQSRGPPVHYRTLDRGICWRRFVMPSTPAPATTRPGGLRCFGSLTR
jgi:hypothetical protein